MLGVGNAGKVRSWNAGRPESREAEKVRREESGRPGSWEAETRKPETRNPQPATRNAYPATRLSFAELARIPDPQGNLLSIKILDQRNDIFAGNSGHFLELGGGNLSI